MSLRIQGCCAWLCGYLDNFQDKVATSNLPAPCWRQRRPASCPRVLGCCDLVSATHNPLPLLNVTQPVFHNFDIDIVMNTQYSTLENARPIGRYFSR